MHLRDTLGFVPVPTRGRVPFKFVPFPSFDEFCLLYKSTVDKERLFKMMKARSDGAEMSDVAAQFGVTKQRVGYLERLFIRKMGAGYASGLLPLGTGRGADENR